MHTASQTQSATRAGLRAAPQMGFPKMEIRFARRFMPGATLRAMQGRSTKCVQILLWG